MSSQVLPQTNLASLALASLSPIPAMDQPWINLQNYTPTEVTLFLIGVILWAYTYIVVVINNYKLKTVEIPLAAICLNFGWEVASVFFFRDGIDMGRLFVIGYALWMAIDVIIVTQMFLYGHTQVSPAAAPYLRPVLAVSVVGSIAAHAFFMTEGFELPMAVISAYVINLAMSVAFCGLVFKPDFNGLSRPAAWGKGLGTGIISISFFLKYPETHFLTTMYVLTALFDVLYLYLLYRVRPNLKGKEPGASGSIAPTAATSSP